MLDADLARIDGVARRLDEHEARYDLSFKAVFEAVRELLEAPRRKRARSASRS